MWWAVQGFFAALLLSSSGYQLWLVLQPPPQCACLRCSRPPACLPCHPRPVKSRPRRRQPGGGPHAAAGAVAPLHLLHRHDGRGAGQRGPLQVRRAALCCAVRVLLLAMPPFCLLVSFGPKTNRFAAAACRVWEAQRPASFAGALLARRGQTTPWQPAISPEPVAHLAQHRLLPLLVDAVLKEPAIDLRMGHRCTWGRARAIKLGIRQRSCHMLCPVDWQPPGHACVHCFCSWPAHTPASLPPCSCFQPAELQPVARWHLSGGGCGARWRWQQRRHLPPRRWVVGALRLRCPADAMPGTAPFSAQRQQPVGIALLRFPCCTHPVVRILLATGQYLAAADGARGGLRQQLGVGMGGPGAIQHLINIHFISPQVGAILMLFGIPHA